MLVLTACQLPVPKVDPDLTPHDAHFAGMVGYQQLKKLANGAPAVLTQDANDMCDKPGQAGFCTCT
jgi:hypothetical protein